MKMNHNKPKLMDTVKTVLRGQHIVLSAYIKRLQRSHTNNLTAHMKALEQKQADTPKSRLHEINSGLKSIK